MSIDAICGGCGFTATVPDEFAGKSGKCKRCGTRVHFGERPKGRSIVIEATAVPLDVAPEVGVAEAAPTFATPAVARAEQVPSRPLGGAVAVVDSPPPPSTVPCPFCAEPIQPAAKKCRHCGEFLDPVLRAANTPQAVAPQVVTPQVIVNNTATAVNQSPVLVIGRAFNPVIAGLLSLFLPGAGQMYKGQPFNGIIWFACVLIGYAAMIVPGILLHVCCVLGAMSGSGRVLQV